MRNSNSIKKNKINELIIENNIGIVFMRNENYLLYRKAVIMYTITGT